MPRRQWFETASTLIHTYNHSYVLKLQNPIRDFKWFYVLTRGFTWFFRGITNRPVLTKNELMGKKKVNKFGHKRLPIFTLEYFPWDGENKNSFLKCFSFRLFISKIDIKKVSSPLPTDHPHEYNFYCLKKNRKRGVTWFNVIYVI